MIIGGWLIYALIYFGFALAKSAWQVWLLYAAYGLYYGLAYGSANAMVADLVPDHLRGTAYGTYNAVIGLFAFPSSLIAGILWQGVGSWSGWETFSTVFLWRYTGAGCRIVHALLDAKNQAGFSNGIINSDQGT